MAKIMIASFFLFIGLVEGCGKRAGRKSDRTQQGKIGEAPSIPPIAFSEFVSHHPVIVLATEEPVVEKDKKIPGVLKFYAADANLKDDPSNAEIHVEANVRGHTSSKFPQKQYAISIKNENGDDGKASLLGMPEGEKWVLYAPYNDKTLMRNHLAYSLSEQMGHYAVRRQYAEVFLQVGDGTTPQYNGIYLLMERIDKGKDRLDVGKLADKDKKSSKDIGGFIFKVDKTDEGDVFFETGQSVDVSPVVPKADKISESQIKNLMRYLNEMEGFLRGSHVKLAEYIDIDSFIDFAILREFASDADALRASNYFHKTELGKLVAGPVWDFNLGFGNYQKAQGEVDYRVKRFKWWGPFLGSSDSKKQLSSRWHQLRQGILSDDSLTGFVDRTLEEIGDPAILRHFTKWPILGERVWFGPKETPPDFPSEIEFLKNWLIDRAAFMDTYY